MDSNATTTVHERGRREGRREGRERDREIETPNHREGSRGERGESKRKGEQRERNNPCIPGVDLAPFCYQLSPELHAEVFGELFRTAQGKR